jgi:peptidoglycan/xylan/chitin deacetylase (PgdA/CDA1 family)
MGSRKWRRMRILLSMMLSMAVVAGVLSGSSHAATTSTIAAHPMVSSVYPQTATAATVVTRGPSTGRVIALTFDAGSDRGSTQRILDILRKEHVHASFSLTGVWTARYPKMARAIVQAGHQLMNHSYDHPSFTGFSTNSRPLTSQARQREIEKAELVIRSVTGRSTKPYFRPPYGEYDQAALRLACTLGYRYVVMWTVDSLGWKGIPGAQVLGRCLAASRPGAIILMHVGAQSTDVSALSSLITQLKARGYGFVSISSLVSGR